jgi:hypothetical protein
MKLEVVYPMMEEISYCIMISIKLLKLVMKQRNKRKKFLNLRFIFLLDIHFVVYLLALELPKANVIVSYIAVIDQVYDAIVPKMQVYKGLLEHLLLSLDEYYAKLFASQKRVVFNRDIFEENTIVVDDEEYDEEMHKIKKNAVEVKS